MCDFEVKCSSAGCDTTVSYSDKMVSHQLVRGLADASIQEKVLALAATEKDLSLKKITEFVLAQETGTRSSKLLGEVAGISRISDYKKGRSDTPPSKSTQERGEEKCAEVVSLSLRLMEAVGRVEGVQQLQLASSIRLSVSSASKLIQQGQTNVSTGEMAGDIQAQLQPLMSSLAALTDRIAKLREG